MSGLGSTRWKWFLGILMCSSSAVWANCAFAQITSDTTLPNNSILTRDGSTFNITGGTQAGANLFHSFKDFSVPTGGTASFNNAADIQNIISRVTGGSVSNIDGLIRTSGSANLFLINPSGIIFGRNASLNIGGSFVGSTANSLKFADGTEFSARVPKTSPLLTISVPIGLQFGSNAGDISVQGDSGSMSSALGLGLRVPSTKTLALVGGNVTLEGAFLNAPGGRIELGSVAGDGLVNLNPTLQGWTLNYQGVQNFGNIRLKRSFVDIAIERDSSIQLPSEDSAINIRSSQLDLENSIVRANTFTRAPGGDVNIDVQRLTMGEGATVSTNTFNTGEGGDLTVNATESVELTGTTSGGEFVTLLSATTEGAGKAGSLTITTPALLVRDGAEVSTSTFGSGKGGNLTVDAQNVQVIGRSANGQGVSGLFTSAESDSTGNAGSMTIKTNTLLVKNGAVVNSSTFGKGNGGSLSVDALDVQVIGRTADGQFPSALSASAVQNSTGDAGSMTIKTNTLLVKDGAQVATSTFGKGNGGSLSVDAQNVQVIGSSADGRVGSTLSSSAQQRNSTGNAGDLTIKTNTLLVKDGAFVSTSTFGAGKGGDLTVDAFDVQVIGTRANGQSRSSLSAATAATSTGNAGDLTVKTNTLLVKDGAGVSVQSLGTGTAGNMTVNARSIRLDNNALLTANTQRNQDPNSEQATININSQFLIMSRNSNIRTNATGENVIGGNINIDTDFLVAFENSDISANSANFRGGNVRINAQGIFGTQFRDMPSNRTSDITATGVSREFGGNVEITTPDVDPSRGLLQLPTNLVDASQQIASSCNPGGRQRQGSFTVTGRGGLPPNPREAFNSDTVRVDWVTLNSHTDDRRQTVTTHPTTPIPQPIVEATGWVMNDKGEVLLIASSPTATPHSSWHTPATCSAPKSEP